MSDPLPSIDTVWRCFRTKPKSEHLAGRQLRVTAAADLEIFCPRLRHRKQTTRGPVWYVEALFPGYLFVRGDWSLWQRTVLATPGVTGLVHFGDRIPAIPDKVVDDLRASLPEDELLTVHELVVPGDEVQISEGPFRGAVGTITRLLPARERVAVLLEFLGGTREIEVPLLSVLGFRDVRQAAFE